MARISTEYNFVGSASTGPIDNIFAPTGISVTFFGSSGVTTYSYKVSALNNFGETLVSSAVIINLGTSSLNSTNFNRITWNKVLGANSYKVYGRTLGNELFMATISTNVYFDDLGTVNPLGSAPTTNTTGYSASRTSMGTLMTQKTGGGTNDNWVGPFPVGLARPMEASTAIATFMPHVIRWSTNEDWVFFADNSTAAVTRRIVYGKYNRGNNAFALEGFVTLGFPATLAAHTVRGFRMTYDIYNAGSVFGTSNTIRGSETLWLSSNIAQGSRIGFGAPDPNYITRWYEISTVANDNSIILSTNLDAGINTNTPYCIEELRAITVTTNATINNAGLFVTKGLRPEIFTVAGNTLGVSSVDNRRATYWLRDGNPVGALNTASIGMGLQAKTGFSSQICYVLDGTTACRAYAYNVRAPLLNIGVNTFGNGFTTGSTFSGWLYNTGAQALTGTAQQINNGRLGNLNHGPGAGTESIYFTTATRVYRAALTDIQNGAANWIADCMVEIPPGSVNTYGATSALVAVEVADSIDRLIITSSGAAGVRHYVTRYQSFVEQFDIIWGLDTKQLDQTLEDPNVPIFPNIQASSFTVWSESGLTYINRNLTTAAGNQVYVVPFGAHWGFQNQAPTQRIITAAINTPNAVSYSKAVITNLRVFGSEKFSVQSEPFNLYYRTYGIEDNSGAWTLLPETGTLTGVSPAAQIQFMIEFKIIGNYCLPARIFSMEMIYNVDDSLPAFLQWNFSDSNNADGTVGFIQKGTYGSVPVLQINYYRADNDINLLTQNSSSTTYGNFQYWNGATWVNGVGTDTDGLRRRFVPSAGLPSNTNVYAKIKVV